MYGYQPGAVEPTTALVLSHDHPEDRPTVAELVEQVRRHGAAFGSRHRIIDANGHVHVVVVVGDVYCAEAGVATGTTGFYVDITEEFNADMQDSVTEAINVISKRRAVINQAIGILMLRHGITADAAFDLLTARSQRASVKLRTVAERFVAAATADGQLSGPAAQRIDALLGAVPKTPKTPRTPETHSRNVVCGL